MIQVATLGHTAMIEYLLDARADPNNFDYASNTPLAASVANDLLECARLLIQNGASLGNSKDHNEISLASPIVAAIKNGNKEMLELLIDTGIDLNTSIQRKSPLIVALTERTVDAESIELLIKHGADVKCITGKWTG